METFEITVRRSFRGPLYTIGHLYLPGDARYFCDTLEDVDRNLTTEDSLSRIMREKVPHMTAIPRGRYRVMMDVVSPKYAKKANWVAFNGAKMPRLRREDDPTQEVPGFSGVLIHPGNVADDTDGCLLVGKNKVKGQVLDSTATFKSLYNILLREHNAGKEIYITFTT